MNNRLIVFWEFLIMGIILGIVEDLILISLVSDAVFTWHILFVVFCVTLPFAFLGEYVVDKIDFLKLFNFNKKYKKTEIFLEFLIFGIIIGVIEDLLAFYFAVGNQITWHVVFVAFIVAIPFAIVSEILIDRVDVLKSFKKRKIIWKNL